MSWRPPCVFTSRILLPRASSGVVHVGQGGRRGRGSPSRCPRLLASRPHRWLAAPRRRLTLFGQVFEQSRPRLSQPAIQFTLDLCQRRPRMLRPPVLHLTQYVRTQLQPIRPESLAITLHSPLHCAASCVLLL